MAGPVMTCKICGRVEHVVQSGRGFPPDTARRRLRRVCVSAGCACDPVYTAGFSMSAFRAAAVLPEGDSD